MRRPPNVTRTDSLFPVTALSRTKAEGGTPVLGRDVAQGEHGPDGRRDIAELNGEGEVASGSVLQRFGSNALNVIANVKQRLAEIAPSLPTGTEIVPVYDRSELIERAIETLKTTLIEERDRKSVV